MSFLFIVMGHEWSTPTMAGWTVIGRPLDSLSGSSRSRYHVNYNFALRTPSFSVGALPGDLADVERIVFIERLIQEGLIVRK